ncbi:HXXEE domain-containing protein [Longimicrobium sp.]|uniref:HXXEE domain-containing protein n=1 Tax=Longimicrobium sp. TaxID=2029185 RepID=UPI002CFA30C4|nr:HXXEE domain-containing protein [Longimicrobium sp.]HSU14085.1 HXXEE domain-containing protein [Longimicrobium sp.]
MRLEARTRAAFLALVTVQALHSAEEYAFRLYDVFPPARFVSGLVSGDPQRGFAIFNLALVAFGFGCWLVPVRRGWPSAIPLAWLWVGIEMLNGVGHPAWSLARGGYTPGVATALVLLPLALLLAWRLVSDPVTSSPSTKRTL